MNGRMEIKGKIRTDSAYQTREARPARNETASEDPRICPPLFPVRKTARAKLTNGQTDRLPVKQDRVKRVLSLDVLVKQKCLRPLFQSRLSRNTLQ